MLETNPSLKVKRSKLPNAGKGLFTTKAFKKGDIIIEYLGNITTWKDLDHDNGNNGYVFYVTRNHVIDSRHTPEHVARYANDAKGLTKVKGLRNNAEYHRKGKQIFIKAITDIAAGDEIFVPYGPEYWHAIRFNAKLKAKEKQSEKKASNKKK